jgi:diguanylate cyclase (GGDEF)-like protein
MAMRGTSSQTGFDAGWNSSEVSRRDTSALPFGRDILFRRIGPVVGITLLTLLFAAPPRAGSQGAGSVLQAAFLAALAAMATLVLPWDRLPRAARAVPALAYLLVVFLARDAPGDMGASYSQLVMIPVIWMALFGGPREVAGGLLAAGGALFAPILAGRTGPGELRHAAVLFGGSAVLGFTIQLFFSQLRAHTSSLYDLASTDALTGVANRRGWEAELQRALAASRRHGLPVSLVMLDLDHFKGFNDEHGHQAGDRLLKEVAARWMSHLRQSDLLARLGGDEFALILRNSPQWAARAIAERLCAAVPLGMACSAGVTAWDGVEPSELLVARGDRALYKAKDQGRNRVEELWSERALAGRTAGKAVGPAPEAP